MEDISNLLDAVVGFLSLLVGERCWSVIAGPGTGSMVSFAFGNKIRRPNPVRNSALSDEQRLYSGEFSVFVRNSSWVVGVDDEVLCSNDGSNEFGGAMLLGLHKLTGATVVSAKLVDDSGGFRLLFDNDVYIQITCTDGDAYNYSLSYLGNSVASL